MSQADRAQPSLTRPTGRDTACRAPGAIAIMAGPPHWTDDELVKRLLRGERRAEGEFYRRMGPVIRAKVLRVTHGSRTLPSSTDDYVQQVFLALLNNDWGRLKARRDVSLAGHVSRIAGQVTVDTIRRELAAKRRPKAGFDDDEDFKQPDRRVSPEKRIVDHALLEALWTCLQARLSATGQHVFLRLYADDVPPKTLAEEQGWRRNRVDGWVRRIREALRKCREALQ